MTITRQQWSAAERGVGQLVNDLAGQPPPPVDREPAVGTATTINHRDRVQARIDSTEPSDLGNAGRLISQHGDHLRFCGPWGKWLVWDGTRWKPDDTYEILRRAKAVARKLWEETRDSADPLLQAKLVKWAVKSQGRDRLLAMADVARDVLSVAPSALDADPLLLNVKNGTVDLRTGRLGPHRQEDLITKLAPVTFDQNAECPLWDRFLMEIMAGDGELIGYLRRLAGLALTADASEQLINILYGLGANGKSLFVDTLTWLLGDYAGEAPPALLMVRGNQEHSTEIADLMGRRLVVASETEESGRLNINRVKQLTGNARIKARFMRENFFEFDRTFKLILVTNHRPVIREDTNGAWRRIRLVPFNVTIPPERQDRKLGEKFRAEASGILAWAVRGCLEWQREGLHAPESVQAVTDEYRKDSDPIADFVADRCILLPTSFVSRGDVFEAYQKWAERNRDHHPLDRGGLFDRLRSQPGVTDHQRRQDGTVIRYFQGIGLCGSAAGGREAG